MGPLATVLLCVSVALCLLLKRCIKMVWRALTSPLRNLPGPAGDSLIFGNIKSLHKAEFLELHEKWLRKYGETHIFHGLFNVWFQSPLQCKWLHANTLLRYLLGTHRVYYGSQVGLLLNLCDIESHAYLRA